MLFFNLILPALLYNRNIVISFNPIHLHPHHRALDELVPSSLVGKTSREIIEELKKNNLELANKILFLFYKIKKNVEYMSIGKESLYPLRPSYKTDIPIELLNCRNSRMYFYIIHKYPTESFQRIVHLAAHLIQNNKIRYEQNQKALQGYRYL